MGTAIATDTPSVEPSMRSVSYLAVESRDIAYNSDRTCRGTVVARLEHLADTGLTALCLTTASHVFREEGENTVGESCVKLVLGSPDAVRALTSCLLELLQNEQAIELLEAVAPDDHPG